MLLIEHHLLLSYEPQNSFTPNFLMHSCLMAALVVMAYVLSIQHGLENKAEKKKIIKINLLGWQFLISDKGVKAKVLSLRMFISVPNDIFKMLTREYSGISSSKTR